MPRTYVYTHFLSLLLGLLSACQQQPKLSAWEISYSRADLFMGNIDIKIGSDSCYYLNQTGIFIKPLPFKWKADTKSLNRLYKKIKSYYLAFLPITKSVANRTTVEKLQFSEGKKLIVDIGLPLQYNKDQKKIDSLLNLLRSFVYEQNDVILY